MAGARVTGQRVVGACASSSSGFQRRLDGVEVVGAGELARRGDNASRAAAGRVDDAQVAPSAIRELAAPDAVGRRPAPVSFPGVERDDVHWFSERGDGVVGEDIPADDLASLSAGPLGEHREDQFVRGGRGAHDALEARGVAAEVAVFEGSELDRPLHPRFGRASAGLRASCGDREAEGLAHRVSTYRKGSSVTAYTTLSEADS